MKNTKSKYKVSSRVKSYVKKELNRLSETKVSDNTNPTAGGDLIDYATPLSDRLTTISSSNSSAYNRDGDKIYVTTMKGRVDCYNVSGTPYKAFVRCLIVRDKMPVRGTETALNTVLPTYTNARMTATAMVSAVDGTNAVVGQNSQRFEVLYDKVKICELKAGENAKDRPIFYINKKIGKTCQYLGNRDTAADIGKGQIYMYVFTDQTDEHGINVNYDVRLQFKDV